MRSSTGYEEFVNCERKLFEVRVELQSYGILFQSLGPTAIDAGDLFGVGVRLKKMSQKLEKISARLSNIVETKE